MQVNESKAGLLSLHKAYSRCLEAKIDSWLKPQTEESNANFEQEFCKTEKTAYLNYMRVNAPTEYENIMRLEEGNYWT